MSEAAKPGAEEESKRLPDNPSGSAVSEDAGRAGWRSPLSGEQLKSGLGRVLDFESNSVLVATIVLAVAIGLIHTAFFAWSQIKDVLAQSVYVGILAAGMAFLISMREIDLSVGSIFGLTLIASALLMNHGMNPWLAAFIGVLLGGACGLVTRSSSR
jgi:ribose transport system permease protein